MNSWVTLEPLSVAVDPGDQKGVSLHIRNTSDVVDEYHVDVVGDPALWCTVEPTMLRLYPGTSGTVQLTFAPPKGPDPAAGPHPYGVRVRPVEAHDAVVVPEGSVNIAPFTDVRAELLPPVSRGWLRARPRLVVDNYGNTAVTASVQASVQDQSVDFDPESTSFQVLPGRAHFGVLTGRPRQLRWLGRATQHPYTTKVTPSGSPVVTVSGTYLQTALLPSWLARVLTVLVGLLAAFVAAWLLAKPGVSSLATPLNVPTPAAATATASPSLTPSPQRTPTPSAPLQSGQAQTSQPNPTQSIVPPSQPSRSAAGHTAPVRHLMPSPLGYWKLIEGASDTAVTTAVDSSRHDRLLTGQNVEWCHNGGCAWFNDGTNAQLTTSGPILNTAPGHSFTVSARVFLDSIPANNLFATAVSQDGASMSDGTTASAFFLQFNGPDQAWSFVAGGDRAETAPGSAQPQTWIYLTGVYNGVRDTVKLYVNGVRAATVTGATSFASQGPLVVGRAQFQNNQVDWWPGGIMNVEVFGSPLSPAQVQRLYQQNGS